MKTRVPNAVIITGRRNIYRTRERSGNVESQCEGDRGALREIVTVIRVYCQTGMALSSSGGSIQVFLCDSQLYLDKVRHWEGSPRSHHGDDGTYGLAFLIVATLGTQGFCGFA